MLFLLNCLPEDFLILHERKDAELLILSLSVNSWNFYTRIFPRRMNEQQPGLGGKGRKDVKYALFIKMPDIEYG